MDLRPDDPIVRDVLGLALAGEGRLDEAIIQFQQALQINPTYTEARENLAIALKLKASGR
jgi:Flp pilus assembly protein TadD